MDRLSTPNDAEELTLEKLLATVRDFKPVPKMPRWKDLTWAQRNMVEREINATTNQVVREAMRADYYRGGDGCPGGDACTCDA